MSNSLKIFPAKREHIEFLKTNPSCIFDFIEGCKPEEQSDNIPDGWPTMPIEPIGFDDAIDRNVDLYHWILNGQSDPVKGAGSLFQTWLFPEHDAINLDGENFAFLPEQLPELVELVKQVNLQQVTKAFTAWCEENDNNYIPDTEACTPFVEEFQHFGKQLEQVIAAGNGIVWLPR